MRNNCLAAAVLLCLVLSLSTFSQSTNATLGGTVLDAKGAPLPGVTIIATNNGTGIVTTVVTNDAGAYHFAGIQPGFYDIKADLPGFQPVIAKSLQLGSAQQIRLNFTLRVGAAGTTVEENVAADTLLTTSSTSITTILPESKLRDLPLAVRDVFGAVAATGGVGPKDGQGMVNNLAGGRQSAVNTTRDGINVSAGRFEDGAWSVTYTSPDLIEEVKVVVSPVDAQASRGSGQVNMVTRSGTNQIRGSVFWANHNSALDANSWFNNFNRVAKNYDNRNQYGARVGGPIVKNRTFFFLLFEGQRDLKRENFAGTTLTDMARQGIFRYFPGVDNANASSANPTVDRNGRPVAPAAATGPLSAIDLFGNCTFGGAPVANCRTFRDALRTNINSSAYMQETLRRMPFPNEFTNATAGEPATEGLNTALLRFSRRVEGFDLVNGNGTDVDRDQYNARIDHNFNSKHKLSVIGTHEKTWGAAAQAGQRSWPSAFDGIAIKRPDVYIVTFTSAVSNTLLNEFRAGRKRSIDQQFSPANRSDAVGTEALQFIPSASGVPFNPIPQLWTGFDGYGRFGRWRSHVSPLYTLADDLSWVHSQHAFKGGYEFRNAYSKGFNDPAFTPIASFGTGNFPISGLDGTAFAGLTATNAAAAQSLLTDLAGSIGRINQSFGVASSQSAALAGSPVIPNKYYQMQQREMSAYFKDEWKFRPDLTLNLGVHWEYYGQPFEDTGLAARIVGDDESALTKVTCTSSPGTPNFTSTCSNLTQVQFVGRNSPNPNVSVNLKGNDLNNFAPAVGFAWNLPWFGSGKTVLRSGYGISYQGALRNFTNVETAIGNVPGVNLIGSNNDGVTYTSQTYTSLSNITLPIPLPGTISTVPFVIPTTDRTLSISTYNRVSPYIQNWNLEIQREVARSTTVEARYFGTKGTRLWGTINLNQIDALHHNKDLFDAFNAVRAGGESALLNQMLFGINLGGAGAQVVNGTTWTGAMAVRTNPTTRAQIANGSVGAFMNTLNLLNTGVPGSGNGLVLRKNGFPDNYLVPNPQFANVNLLANPSSSTYHAMQVQFTRRLANGLSNTTTWTWSKALGDANNDNGATYRDPTRRSIEKTLLGFDRAHQRTSNGTYELPLGTGHFLLGNAPGWVQQIVNRWQIGGIMNFYTGGPLSFQATGVQTISTVAGQPDIVSSLPKDIGKVTKVSNGIVYFDGDTQIPDPSFTVPGTNGLNAGYSNKAIVGPDGKIVLVNPQPGEVGTLGYSTVKGPRYLSLDMDIVKRFKIHEDKEFEFRLDAINVPNHPNFGNPNMNINGANTFGRITTTIGGGRSFVVNTRVNF